MDWQNVLTIVITALLVFVWLPCVFFSVRKAWRKSKNPGPDGRPDSEI